MTRPDLVRPVTIPDLARKLGVPRSTMFRKLLRWHTEDRQTGDHERALWLYRPAGGVWSVNLARLRAAHPEFFDAPTTADLQEQLVEVRDYGVHTRRQVNALHAAFREHRKCHAPRSTG